MSGWKPGDLTYHPRSRINSDPKPTPEQLAAVESVVATLNAAPGAFDALSRARLVRVVVEPEGMQVLPVQISCGPSRVRFLEQSPPKHYAVSVGKGFYLYSDHSEGPMAGVPKLREEDDGTPYHATREEAIRWLSKLASEQYWTVIS